MLQVNAAITKFYRRSELLSWFGSLGLFCVLCSKSVRLIYVCCLCSETASQAARGQTAGARQRTAINSNKNVSWWRHILRLLTLLLIVMMMLMMMMMKR